MNLSQSNISYHTQSSDVFESTNKSNGSHISAEKESVSYDECHEGLSKGVEDNLQHLESNASEIFENKKCEDHLKHDGDLGNKSSNHSNTSNYDNFDIDDQSNDKTNEKQVPIHSKDDENERINKKEASELGYMNKKILGIDTTDKSKVSLENDSEMLGHNALHKDNVLPNALALNLNSSDTEMNDEFIEMKDENDSKTVKMDIASNRLFPEKEVQILNHESINIESDDHQKKNSIDVNEEKPALNSIRNEKIHSLITAEEKEMNKDNEFNNEKSVNAESAFGVTSPLKDDIVLEKRKDNESSPCPMEISENNESNEEDKISSIAGLAQFFLTNSFTFHSTVIEENCYFF